MEGKRHIGQPHCLAGLQGKGIDMYQIDFDRPVRIHFIGIGGISMSGLAEVLLGRGFPVSGSDMHPSPLTEHLEKAGATVNIGQRAENITPDIDVVVYTAAVHPDNPEFAAAAEAGLPMLTRAELLGQMMKNYRKAVAVAGTHGKTTTTSMLAEILMEAEADPTVSVGGMLDSIGGNIRVGKSDLFVTEACEYTNSFLSFFPTVGVILNVGADHLDFFKDLEDIRHSFRRFAGLLPEEGLLVISSNIPEVSYFTEDLPCRVCLVGDRPEDDYGMTDLIFDENGCASFVVSRKGQGTETVKLAVPGEHNAWNALAAIACAGELGVDFESVKKALAGFTGTHRRFEYKGTLPGDVRVVDDYAHHPDEIEATLKAARKGGRERIVCVFQPHTYSRTKALLPEFAKALSLADEIILAKIYPARETDDLGISSADLAEAIAALGKKVTYFATFEEIQKYINKNFLHGELLITMGAGDIDKVGDALLLG